MDAAAAVPQPNEAERAAGRATLLDSWRFHGTRGSSLFRLPSFGSDFQPFLSYAGIPAADLRMTSAPAEGFSFYHTSFETIEAVERLIDPTGEVFVSMARFWAEAALRLADSPVLPFNVGSSYGIFLTEQVRRLDVQLAHLGVDEAIGVDVYRKADGRPRPLDRRLPLGRSSVWKSSRKKWTRRTSGCCTRSTSGCNTLRAASCSSRASSTIPCNDILIFAPSRHRDVFPTLVSCAATSPGNTNLCTTCSQLSVITGNTLDQPVTTNSRQVGSTDPTTGCNTLTVFCAGTSNHFGPESWIR
ncbi:Glutamate carboxypeptidase 2-like protein [Aphelenchoides fujianensis]|nr:Glutamate carboxypeptidase 2-like protein [Aphelenchoides fujianensis]